MRGIRAFIGFCLVAVVGLAIGRGALWIGGSILSAIFEGSGGHTLRADFQNAVQVAQGEDVRIAGRQVGDVGAVTESAGHAVVDLKIADGSVWPLRKGTTARIRWGSTTGYARRYVELFPGPASAPEFRDGGVIPLANTKSPVELDSFYRIFRGRTRSDLGDMVDELGSTFGNRSSALAGALKSSPPALNQAAGVLRELGADQHALRTLVTSGDRTAATVASRSQQLGELINNAAGTFNVLADQAQSEQAMFDRFPGTMDVSTATLGRLDHSLNGVQGLVDDLRPGAQALRVMAPIASEAFTELHDVAPLAASTLERGTRAAPPLAHLLQVGTPFVPQLSSALDGLAPAVNCIRPYGPEITGTLSTWIGFEEGYDTDGHYMRADTQQDPVPVGSPLNSQQMVQLHPGSLFYAMPRPPGLNAGHPWFQPQCGAGPDALDPSKDPEGAGAGK